MCAGGNWDSNCQRDGAESLKALQDGGRANFSKTLHACFLNKFLSNDLISAGSMSLGSFFNSFLSHIVFIPSFLEYMYVIFI